VFGGCRRFQETVFYSELETFKQVYDFVLK
jgi:hypothetical protein